MAVRPPLSARTPDFLAIDRPCRAIGDRSAARTASRVSVFAGDVWLDALLCRYSETARGLSPISKLSVCNWFETLCTHVVAQSVARVARLRVAFVTLLYPIAPGVAFVVWSLGNCIRGR
jgi:hypothetical protein